MRSQLTLGLTAGAVGIAVLSYVGNVLATAPSGFKGTTLATATFQEDIDIFNQSLRDADGSRAGADLWFAQLRTKGPSSLFVQENTWDPGGSTGWHTHPGPSLVIVTEGAVTAYGPDCIPHVYYAQNADNQHDSFIDLAGDHAHLLRNDSTTTVAKTYAVQLIPADAPERRIGVDAPPGCSVQ